MATTTSNHWNLPSDVVSMIELQGYRLLSTGEVIQVNDRFSHDIRRRHSTADLDITKWTTVNPGTNGVGCHVNPGTAVIVRQIGHSPMPPVGHSPMPPVSITDLVEKRLERLVRDAERALGAVKRIQRPDSGLNSHQVDLGTMMRLGEAEESVYAFRLIVDAIRDSACRHESQLQDAIAKAIGDTPIALIERRVSVLPHIHDVLGKLFDLCQLVEYTGSRAICREPELDADLDILALTKWGMPEFMEQAEFEDWKGVGKDRYGPQHDHKLVLVKPHSEFQRVNLIVTNDQDYYKRWALATEVGASMHLTRKVDRINLFRAIVDGKRPKEA